MNIEDDSRYDIQPVVRAELSALRARITQLEASKTALLKTLRDERAAFRQRVEELEMESEMWRVENESRALWISKMNAVLGYDNSDGFHSEPNPHTIAQSLQSDLARVQRESAEWQAKYQRMYDLANQSL